MQKSFDFENIKNDKLDILNGLNAEQKKAVTHKSGPLLIIAGAGTGKTSVITRRIAYIIEQKWAKPSEILALTFTDKAAGEMEERVDQLVPYGYVDMWISTFHAFGDRLLRDFSIDLGLPANFKVLTSTEQAIFMRENLFAFDLKHFRPLSDPTSHIQALLTHFSRLKDELISPETYVSFAQNQKLKIKNQKDETEELLEAEKTLELANAYERYCDLMLQAGNLDFGDQIYLTYKLLKENKKVLKECREKFKYILVDEYQDTNYAQNEIVKLLSGKKGNVTVVGDDDQSIYRFRGASISNILDFNKSYDNITQIVLNKNYRSTQEILDSSYKLIQHNNPDRLEVQNKIDKKLLSKKHGRNPELLHAVTLSSEADIVAKKIVEIKEEKQYRNNDFAILVRANNQAEPFMQSLNIQNLPFIFSGTSSLFLQSEIKMLIAFLKILVYEEDKISFFELATSELYNLQAKDLAKYYALSKKTNRPIIETVDKNDKNLTELVEDIKKYQKKLADYTAGELLYDYLKYKNYLKKISNKPSVADEIKIQNIAKFFDRIAQFDHASINRGVLSFLENLELILEVGDDTAAADIDMDLDAVNVLTAHAAKGLEYKVVFIVNCVSDRFPARRRKDQLSIPAELISERLPEGDFHLQEERRLFYVAATRAKEYLYLTAADDYGGKRAKKLSQFVMELLDEPQVNKLKHKLSPLEKISRFKKLDKEKLTAESQKLKADKFIKLSRQQIDDYFTCPKKYYYAHVIKIPLLENQNLMYGTAIHAALDHYFNRKIKGQKVSLKQLIRDYDQAFKNVGFITREHEEQRHKQGIETLTKFYDEDQKSGEVPSGVETIFEFFEDGVKINGRYDVIYGHNDKIEIRDFKTSDVKNQKDADRRIKESTQMMIYALAWYEKNKVIPKTTLHFIESDLKGETKYSKKELDSTKKMIFEVADGIKTNNFSAKPDLFSCKYCPYRDICEEAI